MIEIAFGLFIGLAAFLTCLLWLVMAQDRQERDMEERISELRRELHRMKRGEEL